MAEVIIVRTNHIYICLRRLFQGTQEVYSFLEANNVSKGFK